MFAKRLLQKAVAVAQVNQSGLLQGGLRPDDLNLHVTLHYGIPSTSSLLSFDPFQRILAVATLDGRTKIIGGAGIECLLDSPLELPCKFLEFMNNEGYLVSISNQNDIQVWDLNRRALACYIQWESNITAFTVIQGTSCMYLGDDLGNVAVVKYKKEKGEISRMPYHIPVHIVQESSKDPDRFPSSVVGIYPQPSASGTRVVIAYENGLIILWDLYKACAVAIRGGANLNLKNDNATSSIGMRDETEVEADDSDEDKEICCACWASVDGSILAVGYTDGDILLWSMPSGTSSKDRHSDVGISSSKTVVKIQLSSSKRRIPVIVLRWCTNGKHDLEDGGQLFVYGGDEIGSPEVVTVAGKRSKQLLIYILQRNFMMKDLLLLVLCLKWSQGMVSLTCTSRLDIALHGSFADMILLPSVGSALDGKYAALLVLTNPGHLHAYDEVSISEVSLSSEEDRCSIPPQSVPVQAPFAEPCITKAALVLIPKNVNTSKILSQLQRTMQITGPSNLALGGKWPVTGGIHASSSFEKSMNVEMIYITGHENGSVRVWDASVPFLCLLCSIENKTQNLTLPGGNASISSLEFCPIAEILAVGDEQGMVRLYKLSAKSADISCQVISEDVKQVHFLQWESGFQCVAVFSIHQSPICSIYFAKASRLCVASEGGLVSVINLDSFTILFHCNCLRDKSTKIISVIMKTVVASKGLPPSPTQQKSERQGENDSTKELSVVFVLTKDENVITIDGDTGAFLGSEPSHPTHQSTAVSFQLIDTIGWTQDGVTHSLSQDSKHGHFTNKFKNELEESQRDPINETKVQSELEELGNTIAKSGESLQTLLLLLCSRDALRLYSAASFIKGKSKSVRKVKLEIPCCWASTFMNKDQNLFGLVLLCESGLLEFRSLPNMEVIGSVFISSLLRWKYHPNIGRTMSSSGNGRIALVYNKEMAFLSILANENDLRIPDSLPCLYDKDLAAATDAALKAGIHQTRKKNQIQGFLGGVIKEIKGGVLRNASPERPITLNLGSDLSNIFAWCPFPELFTVETDDGTECLDIDDIQIEEDSFNSSPSSSSPAKTGRPLDTQKPDTKDKESERQKLLNLKQDDVKPRLRTPEEIKAAYGHKTTGDVSEVAGVAMNRLHERGHKLQKIGKNTEELQAGAENFASMADELLKTMEGRKWWQI
ncbi:uncharacterized protein LOC131062006 isoform X1 [Cryptomeria japonica]|uniref:uncharacterized protein LOC131062006 isoform X1 n=1 Tax=Cryptomeria japonica TaxID=3369 RepID=UPI0027DA92D2|nr:uncharacterized protein LOC131062006 isoform X1 [Cryptomeria japonica]